MKMLIMLFVTILSVQSYADTNLVKAALEMPEVEKALKSIDNYEISFSTKIESVKGQKMKALVERIFIKYNDKNGPTPSLRLCSIIVESKVNIGTTGWIPEPNLKLVSNKCMEF